MSRATRYIRRNIDSIGLAGLVTTVSVRDAEKAIKMERSDTLKKVREIIEKNAEYGWETEWLDTIFAKIKELE